MESSIFRLSGWPLIVRKRLNKAKASIKDFELRKFFDEQTEIRKKLGILPVYKNI